MAEKKSRKETENRGKMQTKAIVGVLVAGLFITAGSIFWGKSDKGAIDVSGAINQSNVAARESIERGEKPTVPVVDTSPKKKNGGLVPTGKQEEARPTPTPEVESASTTESDSDSATSTTEDFGEDETPVNEESNGEE